MRLGRLASIAATLALATTAAPATAAPIEIGHIPECVEAVPASVAAPDGSTVGLQTRVLLDGVSVAKGQEVFSKVVGAYSPIDIASSASFQSVSFSGDSAQGLIDQAKALFGGQRPAGVDVVYVLTAKDIQAGGDKAVAGLADCIGGVAFPSRAFAVGEVLQPDSLSWGDTLVSGHLTGKVAAHELGHLLGGHHHLANCAEGLLYELGAELSPCTLMFNDVGLASLNFAVANAVVVRGHAESYAR